MNRLILSLAVSLTLLGCGTPSQTGRSGRIQTVLQPNASPLVSFRILFQTGSASDPAGQEGIASLTAAMLAQGGTRAQPYEKILEAMYPMATSFQAQVDKEMTVFSGTTHRDNLENYYALIRDMVLDPGFREEDFKRLQSEAINFLKVSLSEGNDEELGKEHLYNVIYRNHPYGHHNSGKVSALEKLMIGDVRSFYREHYRQGTLVVGLAGGYPSSLVERILVDFQKLPSGSPAVTAVNHPAPVVGPEIEIIERETRSTAISLGFPIHARRGDPDWPALALATSYLGQHRSSNSHLYQQLRELRGLNYGDYAYLEYFPRGMYRFQPEPNLGRHEQIFQIWIRPVEPQNAHFALRAALFEFEKLTREGMTAEAFEGTREFLRKFSAVLLQTQDERLGYALDSRFYGIERFDDYLRKSLARLSLDDVNRAIRKHLRSDSLCIVVVTKDGTGLKDAIVGNKPSPITYASAKPAEVMEEDKIISAYPLKVATERVKIVPVARVFE